MNTVKLALLIALALASPAVALPVFAQVGDESKKSEAIKHFEIGLELAKQEAWDPALAEFLRSRELYPTKNALKNAAMCLRELKRFDEALDMYDELVTRFGSDLTPAEKSVVEEDQKKLDKFVGTIAIQCDTAGARVVVDGRERGSTPVAKPIRVTVGTRAITISKAGYASYETKVMVSSGESKTVAVKLASMSSSGKLRVIEAKGRAFDVVLDGAVVGKTPWEGTVAAGTHTVSLRGPSDEGTVAKPVVVTTDKPTELALEAAKLPAELRVDPTPANADIFVDEQKVGAGPFKGDLAPGAHVVSVRAPWHREQTTTVTLISGRAEALTFALDRIRRWSIEFQPIFNPASRPDGRFASSGTNGMLKGAFGVTIRVGYKVHPHIAVELGTGLLNWSQSHSGNDIPLSGGAGKTNGNLIDEALNYAGPVMMLSASAHFGDSFPIVLRLVTGVWFATQRSAGGRFRDEGGDTKFPDVSVSSVCPLAGPEARFGVRLSRVTTLDVGVLVFFLRCGERDFGRRVLPTGESVEAMRSSHQNVLWAPTLGLRIEL